MAKKQRWMSVTYWDDKGERDRVMAWLERHQLSWNAFSKEQVEAALKRLDRKAREAARQQEEANDG